MKTALLAIIFFQAPAITSTEPVVFMESATTATSTVEVYEECISLMVDVLTEMRCAAKDRPVFGKNGTFSELVRCVEQAREQAESERKE